MTFLLLNFLFILHYNELIKCQLINSIIFNSQQDRKLNTRNFILKKIPIKFFKLLKAHQFKQLQ